MQGAALDGIKAAIVTAVIEPAIWLLFSFALLYFLWGVTKFIMNADNEEERSKGKQHMLWGVVGMAIMISAFGLIHFVFNVVTSGGTAEDVTGNQVQAPSVIKNGSFFEHN